ncbi:MAG: hypothetical protein ABH828_01980 [archaeon]
MVKKDKNDYSEIISYMDRLYTRMADVQEDSNIIMNDVKKKEESLQRTVRILQADVQTLKKAAVSAKQIVENQKRIIRVFVNDFKSIAKQDKFDRLKETIDNWNPENILTWDEVKKNI